MRQDRIDKEVARLLKILERKTDETLPEVQQSKVKLAPPKKEKVLSVNRQKKLFRFMEENQLSNGRYFLESFLLYYYFLDWSNKGKRKKTVPLSFKNFCTLMRINYKSRLTKKGTLYFGLNKDVRKGYLNSQREAAIKRWNNLDGSRK